MPPITGANTSPGSIRRSPFDLPYTYCTRWQAMHVMPSRATSGRFHSGSARDAHRAVATGAWQRMQK
jgi:hypothetical protein